MTWGALLRNMPLERGSAGCALGEHVQEKIPAVEHVNQAGTEPEKAPQKQNRRMQNIIGKTLKFSLHAQEAVADPAQQRKYQPLTTELRILEHKLAVGVHLVAPPQDKEFSSFITHHSRIVGWELLTSVRVTPHRALPFMTS